MTKVKGRKEKIVKLKNVWNNKNIFDDRPRVSLKKRVPHLKDATPVVYTSQSRQTSLQHVSKRDIVS